MQNSLGKRLALVGASSVLALLLCEGLLRVAGFAPLRVNPEQLIFWRHDPALGWHHRPGQSGRFSKEDFDTEVRINAHGLRDREHPLERPADVARVLVLGDSLVWGFGVEQDEIFTEVIEGRLDAVEVINAGVSGYGTDQELLWLEAEGLRYEPDLVVLLLTGNDIAGNHTSFAHGRYHKPRFVFDAEGGLALTGSPAPEPPLLADAILWARRHSALFEFVHLRLRRLPWIDAIRFRLTGEKRTGSQASAGPPHDLTLALVETMVQRSRERGADFLLVVVEAFWGEDGAFDRFAGALAPDGPPTLLIQRGADGYEPDRLTFAEDPHWNAAGHAYVAERLLQGLAGCRPGACRFEAAAP